MSFARTESRSRGRVTDVLRHRGWVLPLIVLFGAILVTVAVYGSTLAFSFMMDDAFDTTWTEQRTYVEILTRRFPGFGYFRPLPFLIFKASYDLTGEHNTTLLRTILLSSHILASWVLYLLLRRLMQSEWALAAWALFLLFPFSYQALNVIGAIGHVLVTLFLLGALLFWYEGRRRNVPWLLIFGISAAVVAVWTIEYGIIALPLLLGLELWIRRQEGEPFASLDKWPYFTALAVAQLVYLLLWFGTDRPDSDPVAIGDMARNAVFWLQVVAYPLTRFLNIFATDTAPGYVLVLTISAIVLIIALATHFILQQTKMALVTLAVALLCFLPSLFMLTHEYVLSGPRLLYVVAPAIVTFWAMLGRAVFANKRLNAAWQALMLLFVVITLWHSHSFIERRVTMFQASNQVIDEVINIGDSRNGSPTLLVNVPAWFSFHSLVDQEYPIGHLGVQGIPSYVGLDGLYYAARGTPAPIESVSLSPDVSGWRYAFEPHGPHVDHDEINRRLREGQELFAMRMIGNGPRVVQPGSLIANNLLSSDGPIVAQFDPYFYLNTLSWSEDGGELIIESEWSVLEPLPADYQLHVRVLDSAGDPLLEHRDYALAGLSAPRLWETGDTVIDRSHLEIDEGAAVGSVLLALINTGDETHLPITNATADVVNGHWVRITR